MKRVLLSFGIFLAFTQAYSQRIVINEIYPHPKTGNSEYVELYNTTASPVNLDCFTLISYYSDNGGGAWVYNLPDVEIGPFGHIVLASAKPVKYQGSGNTPAQYNEGNAISWNNQTNTSSLKNYTKSSNSLIHNVSAGTFASDFIPISNGNLAAINLMLWDGSELANAIFANSSGSAPADILALNPLTLDLLENELNGDDCPGSATLVFSTMGFPEVEVVTLQSNVGADNGYYRTRDGFCGTWAKGEQSNVYTPGIANSNLEPIDASASIIMQAYMDGGCGSLDNGNKTRWDVEISVTDVVLLPATYRIYADLDHSGTVTIGDGQPLRSGPISTTTAVPVQDIDVKTGVGLIVQVFTASGCIKVSKWFSTQCSPLPVTFSNFHAQRNKQAVELKWATASEQNNRGFNVQRNTRGVWETVAFVFSQADGGNSDGLLSYEFKDQNSEKGVSQYRIQQVDLDGKASYSAIRSVKGLEQAGTRTVVYPNPSSDGKVSVVFEDQGAKAVTVSDLSGRIIRQFRNVLNNVQIEGLESGMYSIQITDLSSAVSSTEKVIIKKR